MATKKAIEKVEVKTAEKETKKIVKKAAVKTTPKAATKVVAKKKVVKKIEVKTEEVKTETKVEVAETAPVAEVKEEGKAMNEMVSKNSTTIEELFEAGAHFGHVVKKWNPKMRKYIWGEKNGIHIFDLEKTFAGLNEAAKELTKLAEEGKRIVLVGTKRQAKPIVEAEAKRIGLPFISQRWMGGLITNWKQVKQTIDRLNSLKLKRETGQLKKYTKREQVLFDKEIARLERVVGGISTLKDTPEVVVVIDTHKERLVAKEAKNRGVTVVGLVDSNANPDMVDFVIPMNDDSAKALEIAISVLGNALELGMKRFKDVEKK